MKIAFYGLQPYVTDLRETLNNN